MPKVTWFHIDEILKTWESSDYYNGCQKKGKTKMESILIAKRKDKGYEQLKESIKLYGLKKPLSYTIKNGKIEHFNGHHRLAALIDLGYTMIPYVRRKSYNTKGEITTHQWVDRVQKYPKLVHMLAEKNSYLVL